MRRLLKSHGYTVAVFPSAAEFLASTQLPATVCLVADIHMPVMTGVELYRHLIATGHAIPTILITGFPDARIRADAEELGAECVIEKPFDLDELRAAVQTALQPEEAAPYRSA